MFQNSGTIRTRLQSPYQRRVKTVGMGPPMNLNNLLDVDAQTGLVDNAILVYNDTSGLFELRTTITLPGNLTVNGTLTAGTIDGGTY